MHTFGLLTTLNLFIWQYESLNKYIAKLKDINKNEKINTNAMTINIINKIKRLVVIIPDLNAVIK